MNRLNEQLDQIAYELIYCKCGGGKRIIHVADVLEAFQRAIHIHELTKQVDGTPANRGTAK